MKLSKSRRRRIRKLAKGLRVSAARARAWEMPEKLRPYFTLEQWERNRISVEATLIAAAKYQESRTSFDASNE